MPLILIRPSKLIKFVRKRVGEKEKSKGRAILAWLETNPLPEHARRSAAEIDAAIADERSSWD